MLSYIRWVAVFAVTNSIQELVTANCNTGCFNERCTHLIEMLWVDLPEAAWCWLAEQTGPAHAQPGAGVGPGSVSRRDLEPRARRWTAGSPAEMRRRGLAQSLLGRSWSRTGIHSLTGDLGVVEVLFSLRLIWASAAHVVQTDQQTQTERKPLVCLKRCWKLHSLWPRYKRFHHFPNLKILYTLVFFSALSPIKECRRDGEKERCLSLLPNKSASSRKHEDLTVNVTYYTEQSRLVS